MPESRHGPLPPSRPDLPGAAPTPEAAAVFGRTRPGSTPGVPPDDEARAAHRGDPS